MSVFRRLFLAFIFVAVLAPFSLARAQPSMETDTSILLKADELTHYQELDLIVASGNVEVIRGDEILRSDNLTFNQREDVITATGNVSLLSTSGDVLFASNFELTGDMKDGVAQNLGYLLSDGSRAAGAAGRRSSGRNTTLYKAVYSPCELCEKDPTRPPLWQLKAYQINHDDKLQRIEYKDVIMEMFGVPVFYLPYLSHPDPRKKRETGFLVPSYGSNSDLGAFVQTPYYLNIAPDKDATLQPIWYLGGPQLLMAGEYRQRFTNGEMKLYGSITRESDDTNSEGISKNRGHIVGTGDFDIDDTWRWGFDLDRASDDTYLRRYGFPSPPTLTSSAFIEGFRERNYATANTYNFQDLRGIAGTAKPPEFVTTFDYNHVGEPGRGGAYWTLDSNATTLFREGGTDSNSLHAKGAWHLPYRTRVGEIYDLSVSLQGDGYLIGDTRNPDGTKSFNGLTGRILPQMNLQWRFPLIRARESSSDIIEPIVALRVAPNVGSERDIPNEDSLDLEFDDTNLFSDNRFTGSDRVEGGQRIDYGLKWTGNYGRNGNSEVFIGQSFRFREDNKFVEGSGLSGQMSDFVGRITVAPAEYFNFGYRFRVDRENLNFRRSETSLNIGPKWFQVGADHIFIDGEAGTGGFGDREEIRGTISAIPYENWKATLSSTWRLNNPEGMVSTGFSVMYEDECFKFITSFSRQNFEDSDLTPSNTLMFRLVFKNIGQLSSPRFTLGRDDAASQEGVFDQLKGWRFSD